MSPHDVKPVLDLDKQKIEIAARKSAILDSEVIKHLLDLLVDEKNKSLSIKV